MKITGQILRENREKQDVTISEVSSSTKINSKVIIAIEEGDMDSLPPLSFLKGFIRTYAKYLKLDADHILQTFNEELGMAQPEPEDKEATEETLQVEEIPAPIKSPPKRKMISQRSLTSKSVLTLGIVVLIIFVVFIRNVIEKYEQEGQVVEKNIVPEAIVAEEKSEEIDLGPEESSDVSERPEMKLEEETTGNESDPPVASTEPVTSEEVDLDIPAAPKVVVENDERNQEAADDTKTNEETAAVTEPEEKLEPAEENTETAEEESPLPTFSHEVIVEALDRLQLEYKTDADTTERATLEANQLFVLKANKLIEIELSDAGATNIIYNGREIGIAGDLGEKAKLRFPKQ